MINRVDKNKHQNLRIFEQKYRNVIKNWNFQPGRLVQVRNTSIEKSLNRKMYVRYKGPMVVIRRTKGGSYIIAEMDGTVLKEKVAVFCVIPHVSHYEPIELPENIHELIDLMPEQLDALVKDKDDEENIWNDDYIFNKIPNINLDGAEHDSDLEKESNHEDE